jgi:hypothetical protein
LEEERDEQNIRQAKQAVEFLGHLIFLFFASKVFALEAQKSVMTVSVSICNENVYNLCSDQDPPGVDCWKQRATRKKEASNQRGRCARLEGFIDSYTEKNVGQNDLPLGSTMVMTRSPVRSAFPACEAGSGTMSVRQPRSRIAVKVRRPDWFQTHPHRVVLVL